MPSARQLLNKGADNRALPEQARKPANIVDVLTQPAELPSPWPSGTAAGAAG
jgi:hypothetical protein